MRTWLLYWSSSKMMSLRAQAREWRNVTSPCPCALDMSFLRPSLPCNRKASVGFIPSTYSVFMVKCSLQFRSSQVYALFQCRSFKYYRTPWLDSRSCCRSMSTNTPPPLPRRSFRFQSSNGVYQQRNKNLLMYSSAVVRLLLPSTSYSLTCPIDNPSTRRIICRCSTLPHVLCRHGFRRYT